MVPGIGSAQPWRVPPARITCDWVTATVQRFLFAVFWLGAATAAPAAANGLSYVPIPDLDGFDSTARFIRVNPTGSFAGASGGTSTEFRLSFRIRVR